MEEYKEKLIRLIKKEIKIDRITVEIPPSPELGDFSLPCFSFAKELKKNPVEIAGQLKEKIKADFIERIETKGPYLNFFIKKGNLIIETIDAIKAEGQIWLFFSWKRKKSSNRTHKH